MYEKRFGLKRRPFPATPDTSCYYSSGTHEAALTRLLQGIEEDEGLMLLTGLPGTGKTLLGYTLLDRAPGEIDSAFLTNSHLADRAALLQAILYDLNLDYTGAEQVLRLRVTDRLLKNCSDGVRTLIIIDEAHHLSADLLEELRLLANLEAGAKKAVQVLLLAQPRLLQTLHQPQMDSLQQRLSLRPRLEPLDVEEACDYLLHHLRLAGGKPEKILDEHALQIIARGAAGIPRLLNQAMHQALTLADSAEADVIDTEAALEALTVLGIVTDEVEESDEGVIGAIGDENRLRKTA